MSTIEYMPSIETRAESDWRHYLVDTLLAVAGALAITGLIFVLHLYPRIPNMSVAYLLVVLALASTRGRYAAILTSIVAFFSFDFFLVPPLFMFSINRIEEWFALFVFLAVAIITGQLAAALRQRAEEANRREREARILYELVRAANSEEDLEHQLSTIAQAVVTVFASWGVHECTLVLPDTNGTFTIQASAPASLKPIVLSSDEYATAKQVMKQGNTLGLHEATPLARPITGSAQRIVIHSSSQEIVPRLYLLPLKTGQRVVGVMRLRLQGGPLRFPGNTSSEEKNPVTAARTTFFWTFLDQATSVIERARLRRENFRIEVLQRTDALRVALLSSVSHDLRTPLASIKAAASSLVQDDVQWDEEARRSFALTIEREADRLNRLVGNLLDMSRIEEGAIKPEKEWFPIGELIHDVLDRLRILLQGRDVHVQLPKDVPPVELDYVQMDQVMTNLIENAVRYTPAASPIDVSVERENSQLLIRVADRGPGIPVAELERVFDKFYRVQQRQNGTSYPTGSGLGLAVCKGLIEAHGGHIWAEPRPGGGVIFSIKLPLGQAEKVSA